MNRILKIMICAVVVVWLFSTGIVIGTFSMRQKYKTGLEEGSGQNTQIQTQTAESVHDEIVINMVTNVAPPTETTTQAVTEMTEPFSVELPTDNGNNTTYEAETQKTLAVPSGNEEIARALVNAVNQTKAMKGFNAVKNEKAEFVIDEITGGSVVKNIADSMVEKYSNKPAVSYSFSNGVDTNGSGNTPTMIIAPAGDTANIDVSSVKSASAQPNSDGGYDVTLMINEETQTLTQKAAAHSGIFDTLKPEDLSLPSSLKVTQMNCTYSDSEIKASINADGRLTSIYYTLPVSQGSAEGSMLGTKISVRLHGKYTASVEITY